MIRNSITGKDGKAISIVEWAEVESPKAIIQIAHGMAEHAMRYDGFAKDMNKLGIIVVADDHRAHGKTDNETLGYSKGNIWEDTLSDMSILCDYAKEKYSKEFSRDLPVILFGHSYGSFLSQAFIRRFNDKIDGAILGGSNFFKGPIVGVGKIAAKIGCIFKGEEKPNTFLKKASFDVYNKNFTEGTFISSIVEQCEKYKQDPECGFVCSSNFYYNFFKGVSKLYKKEGQSLANFNILLIAGDKDPVGNMGKGVLALNEWYKKQGAKVNVILYEGVRHEYLNDTSAEQSRKDIASFVLGFSK